MLIEMHSFFYDAGETSVLFILAKFISQNVTPRPSFSQTVMAFHVTYSRMFCDCWKSWGGSSLK